MLDQKRWRDGLGRATAHVVIVSLAVACSNTRIDDSLPDAWDDAAAVDLASVARDDAASLIDSFFVSDPTLELARIELASKCLRTRGISDREYRQDAHDHLGRSDVPRGATGLLPPLDANTARREGYPHHVNVDVRTSAPVRLPVEVLEALSPTISAVVEIEVPGVATVGTKSEGCIAEANEQLFGSLEDWLLVDQYIPATLRSLAGRALASSEVQMAATSYERCMETGGVEAANPAVAAQIARKLFGERKPGEPPSREELSMAELDATCQESSTVHANIDKILGDLATDWFLDDDAVLRKAVAARERAHSLALCLVEPVRNGPCEGS